MSKLLIIGGSGFIGSALCKSLLKAKDDDFLILDKAVNSNFADRTIIGDIRFQNNFESKIPKNVSIINLAAEHRDDVYPKSLYDQTNVDGAKNICAVARAKSIKKIIFTSSVAVYGFAPRGTDELGEIKPFNDYGRTKWEAELIYKSWYFEDPKNRTLVIIRPTVVFGEGNRGNVYNLFKQIASGNFVMIGSGKNIKSMAYVGNVAAFIKYSLKFEPGLHVYNYVDKPDFNMNKLVEIIMKSLEISAKFKIKIPYNLGISIGYFFDFLKFITGRNFVLSSIRIKKFCANSMYESAIKKTKFTPPFSLLESIKNTILYEFKS